MPGRFRSNPIRTQDAIQLAQYYHERPHTTTLEEDVAAGIVEAAPLEDHRPGGSGEVELPSTRCSMFTSRPRFSAGGARGGTPPRARTETL